MSAASVADDTPAWWVEEDEHHPGDATLIGFWIYLMSDALIFATLFAVHGVVGTSFAGGPSARELFALPLVAVNTAILLVSSLTFGLAMLALQAGRAREVMAWLVVTGLLGMGFVGVELYEFSHLIAEGAGPQRSAFLSSFFTLVATHGLHVTIGIFWIGVMLVQLSRRGLDVANVRRVQCLSLFWHFLDIVWIGVFTFVYLFAVIR